MSLTLSFPKFVYIGALEIIEKAKVAGLDLVIGGLVGTRLVMGFVGQHAAGIGYDPILEGYEVCNLMTLLLISLEQFQVSLISLQMLWDVVDSFPWDNIA
ncbi:hypothetical protein Fmac_005959 [Flemingia macrophylla]|uniref:Uncharacterized protein n=1 Tax=Flemingia macrophylla TaxID=520843 RepID=A0ABD1N9A9_9FABA